MNVDRVGEETILVTLDRDDMTRYSIDFSSDDCGGIQQGLTRLMVRVGEACGLDHRDKSYLIEALPAGDSCLLIISVRTVKRRRIYRIKRVRTVECCVILSCDDLLDVLRLDRIGGFRLYCSANRYYLFPDRPLSDRTRAILNEYGAVIGMKAVAAARIAEYGEPLAERFTRPTLRLTMKKD